jgi:mannose/fructose-specific phosphotransferase system component IIA
MNNANAARAIVAGHASLADGLISAVAAITGRGDVLRAVSGANLTASDVTRTLERALDDTGATVVFTDLPGGSCTLAARRLQRDRPGLAVVIGVNLPMLLEFVMRESAGAADAAAAMERGRDNIRIFDATNVR